MRMRLSAAAALAIVALGIAPPASGRTPSAAERTISAVLREKTQRFSDAGQRGNDAEMAGMLNDRVAFFNESGERIVKADMLANRSSAPSGVTAKMTIEDWSCEVHGGVAVTSFIDDLQQSIRGEPFHARYRSVETWLKEGNDWLMIASQTTALHDDPRTIEISPEELEEYVGTYEAASGQQIKFTRNDSRLMASLTGGPVTLQKIEVRDVIFTPGRARFTKVFERDANGKVIGFFLRREGHDTHFKRI